MKRTIVCLITPLLLLGLIIGQNVAEATEKPIRVLVIGAHPDDCDVKMGGTAALFAEMGHKVKFISVTNGDAGHFEQGGGILAKRRRAEAHEAGKRLGIAEYEVMDYHDAELLPKLEIRHEILRRIREWKADIVVGHRPNDYHPDHRYSGMLVQDAAYLVIVPNTVSDTEPLKKNPIFLYMQDHFEKPYPFAHDITVDIDQTIDKKVAALDAHVSQMYEWIPWTRGQLDAVPESASERKEWLRKRWAGGSLSSEMRASLEKWYGADHAAEVQYAESFEICEYGHQPTDEEIRELFPMLKKE